MFRDLPKLSCPGLFITGTDTGVGKTVVTCAIAWALRSRAATDMPRDGTTPGALSHRRRAQAASPSGTRIGVLKPMASGCRKDRQGLVSEDAEALAHWADCRQPLDVINPIRFAPPLAPGPAAEITGDPVDWQSLSRAITVLDANSDAILIEGVGGLIVPLDPIDREATVLALGRHLDLPAVVVCRATLGTLNHTAMTVRLLKDEGIRVAGLVINGYEPDESRHTDPSMSSNRRWLDRLTRVPTLAIIPPCAAESVQPHQPAIPGAILDAVGLTDWWDVIAPPR